MLLTILPFFLAARVPSEDDRLSEWQRYGAESTYDVSVNASLSNVGRRAGSFCSAIVAELKCRPKHTDSLVCRFASPRVLRARDSCSNANDFEATSEPFVDPEPFEVRFNSRGVENLVVRRTISRWKLDTIKSIVGQLHVGFEVDDRRDRFILMENSTAGYCEARVTISRVGTWDEDDEKVELVLEKDDARFFVQRGRALLIEKIRQPNRCSRKFVHFFGNHEDYRGRERGFYMDTTSSRSRIFVSKRSFSAETVSEGVTKKPGSSRTIITHQKISVALKSVDPARSEPPTIHNPASTSVYAYSNVDSSR